MKIYVIHCGFRAYGIFFFFAKIQCMQTIQQPMWEHMACIIVENQIQLQINSNAPKPYQSITNAVFTKKPASPVCCLDEMSVTSEMVSMVLLRSDLVYTGVNVIA